MIVILNSFDENKAAFEKKWERLFSSNGGKLRPFSSDSLKDCPAESFFLLFRQNAEVNNVFSPLPPFLNDHVACILSIDLDTVDDTCIQDGFPCLPVPYEVRLVINPVLLPKVETRIRMLIFPEREFQTGSPPVVLFIYLL